MASDEEAIMNDAVKAKSVDPDEIANFEAMAEEWWDENGKFKPLHKFNPIRIGYVRDTVVAHFGLQTGDAVVKLKPFTGLKVLDIGCGGGLLSEPMARLGADVTAADASRKNIQIAALHAEKNSLDIDYRHTTAEELAASGEKFDVILNMEVILRWLPKGTHSWRKFLKPSEVARLVRGNDLTVKDIAGATYNPFEDRWHISKDLSINYLLAAAKPA